MQLTAQNRVDSVLWITYQFEREHGRMRMALRNAVDSTTPETLEELVLRYDIFFSRFDLVKTSRSLDYLHGTKEYNATVKALDTFVKNAEPVVAGLTTTIPAPGVLNNLLNQARADDEVLRDLTNFSTNTVNKDIDARNATIKDQSQSIFVLAGLQWLIVLGTLIGFITYLRRRRLHDLELARFTRRLHQASRRAESANQAKSVFLANMSHELRTPFQGLLGMLNLLSGTHLSSTQQDYAHTAVTSARHLLRLLNDILDVSAIESGSMKLRIAPVHLGDLIGEIQALMQVAANDKHIDLKIVLDALLPDWIEADATRLSQILFNLLSNAIKFTDEGEVELRLSLLSQDKSAPDKPGQAPIPQLQINVKDTGEGIDPATLDGLFTRFHQADSSMQRRHGGTGLGLEISRNLVQMMDGHINVQSNPGLGTLFTVTLPLRAAAAPTATHNAPYSPLIQRSLKILVVDDHPVNAKYLSILLRQMGHTVSQCENGAQAVICLQTQSFDMTLMDLHMPVMDGISATRAIRQLNSPAGATKIIIVSADILNDTRQRAFEAGVDGFIDKPVQEDSLRKALALCDAATSTTSEEATRLAATGSNPPAVASARTAVQWVEQQTYQDFVDLLSPETVKQQHQDLFGTPDNQLKALGLALSTHHSAEAARLAHQLKGVCQLMGLTGLARTLADIENASANQSETMNLSLQERLVQDARATQTALESLGAAVISA